MKHIFVALTFCLSIMIITKSRPVFEPEPYHYDSKINICSTRFCLRRPDGYCRIIFSYCDFEKLRCLTKNSPWRWWSWTHIDECMYCSRANQITACASSCPPKNCDTTEPVCGANGLEGHCLVYPNLCKLLAASCKNADIFRADMQKCTNASLYNVGDSGKC